MPGGDVGLPVLRRAGHQAPLTPWSTLWGTEAPQSCGTTQESRPWCVRAGGERSSQRHPQCCTGTWNWTGHVWSPIISLMWEGPLWWLQVRWELSPETLLPETHAEAHPSLLQRRESLRSAPPLGGTPDSSKASARIGFGRAEIFVPGVYQLCTAIILPGDSLAVRQAFILSRNLQRHL